MTLPLLALLASPRPTDDLVPLVVALRSWTDPRAADPALGPPAAWLAADPWAPGIAAALRGPAPVAVVVENADRLPAPVRDRAAVLVARDAATADALADERTLLVRRDLVRTGAHRPATPFLRSRWRRRLGLPDPMVARVGTPEPWPVDDADVVPVLATAGAAVVVGAHLLTALALATPVVTSAGDARRIGATPGVHVLVAPAGEMVPVATALAADWPRAAALGWGGRTLVEASHDLDAAALALVEGLGLGPPGITAAPLAELDGALHALGTPTGSLPARRALARAAGIAGPADWSVLTGRRQ